DLSLVVDVFNRQVVNHPEFYTYFSERFRHMLVDNVEEQTPAGQQFVRKLMGVTQSTAIAYDAGGGYRRFLSADPTLAQRFYQECQTIIAFNDSFTSNQDMNQLGNWVEGHLLNTRRPSEAAEQAIHDLINRRYRREMLIELPQHLHQLLADGVAPRDIAIVGPYLDGALRYSLTQALREAGIPFRILRRRSSPREEPRVRAWLTWLALAHPHWDIHPDPYDVVEALTLSLAGFDPARATLLVEQVYERGIPALHSMDRLSERLRGIGSAWIGWDDMSCCANGLQSMVVNIRQIIFFTACSMIYWRGRLSNQSLIWPGQRCVSGWSKRPIG
ncbi:MAG: hypothetical protein IPL78_05595, partial [Chloroflexi bacterium]|nr:hypothetical protein [Chloroflexota bacterium]